MIQNLYQLPVYLLGGASFAVLFLAAYTGFLAGRRRRRQNLGADEGRDLSRSAVAGLVGVVALLLAFTLGYALSRHQERREAIVTEANTVMTAFLRADLLPSGERRTLQTLIRDYAATRIFKEVSDIGQAVNASLMAQEKLWPQAIALTDGRIAGPERALVLSSVNDVLDAHLLRSSAATQRIPLTVLVLSVVLGAAAVFLSALNETAERFPAPAFFIQTLGIAMVVMLILDFDNARQGMIQMDAWIMSSTVADMDRILDGG